MIRSDTSNDYLIDALHSTTNTTTANIKNITNCTNIANNNTANNNITATMDAVTTRNKENKSAANSGKATTSTPTSPIVPLFRINRNDIILLKQAFFNYISTLSHALNTTINTTHTILNTPKHNVQNLTQNEHNNTQINTSLKSLQLEADPSSVHTSTSSNNANISYANQSNSANNKDHTYEHVKDNMKSNITNNFTNKDDTTIPVLHAAVHMTVDSRPNTPSPTQPPHTDTNTNTSKETKHISYAQRALQHAGLNFEAFQKVILSTKFTNLASKEVFQIFDWNASETVDYLEFLFTLSSFRNDVDWNNAESVARMYYDIFDMEDTNSISIDVLTLVLNKLLYLTDMNKVITHDKNNGNSINNGHMNNKDNNNNTGSNSSEDTNEISKNGIDGIKSINIPNEMSVYMIEDRDVSSVLESIDMSLDDDMSNSSVFDIVQSIDSDGDGEITFKDFETFFNVILHLRSMSSV
jgi:Ca2+-binding EF-hand superfamily protein